MRSLLFYLCLSAVAMAAEIRGDLLRMQGTWVVERAMRDGQELSDRKDTKFTFKGDQLSVVPLRGKTQSTPIHLSESDTPRRLFIDGLGPKEECKPLNCVYEWSERGLIICMADPEASPKEVSDRGQTMCVLRREKGAEQGARANDHSCHAACFHVWGIRTRHGCTRRASCGRGSSMTLGETTLAPGLRGVRLCSCSIGISVTP